MKTSPRTLARRKPSCLVEKPSPGEASACSQTSLLWLTCVCAGSKCGGEGGTETSAARERDLGWVKRK